ncbi:NAD(P)H-dependent flavin oxidoreductase [Chryseolinea lacunae]|uniref:Nitronate monooxygenase n=1 Tax=Chryseolinea lacunae TaxID=2801331 RepID=A0ABS1KPI2_9BACT|nr:nitronate monooxygenase [Chryseolinea lacunae]MBL0740196.1 nitronate monooxygenase [Chryseolinea lacunae]
MQTTPAPTLDKLLGIDYPFIMAPMFLISNSRMVKVALREGISAAFPALNYRTDQALREAITDIQKASSKPFGVNLIVNRSNPKYKKQLATLLEMNVAYIITSLGNPKEVIEQCKPRGIKVFCDVVDLAYAQKVEGLGADAVIAVNDRAGGHAGHLSPKALITELKENCSIPIITAGGIAQGQDLAEAMRWGAAGASVGTLFMACDEADISPEYKKALVDYGEKDIVRTSKLSGSPLTVINTPYVQQLGTQANFLEWLLHRNKALKKYVKMLIALRGMKSVERAAFGATYKTVWCAGPAIENIHSIQPLERIIQNFKKEFDEANKKMNNL